MIKRKEKRSATVQARVTARTFAAVQVQASAAHGGPITMSDWINQLIERELNQIEADRSAAVETKGSKRETT